MVEPAGSFPPFTSSDAQWFSLGLLPAYGYQTIANTTGGASGAQLVAGALMPALRLVMN